MRERKCEVTHPDNRSRLTDPKYCVEQAQRLLMPVTEENWERVSEDADALNILQAAVTHLVYADAEREQFQEQLLQTVFTAYLMGREAEAGGRAAGKVAASTFPEAFAALIGSLDLSGLDR
jgi:hypothetical protein